MTGRALPRSEARAGARLRRLLLGGGVTSSGAARLLSAAGLGAGALLLLRPQQVVATLAPGYPPARLWAARLLGARLVAQHAAVLVAPRAPVLRAAAAVDALHAVSMLPVLALPRYRRAALVSGTLAAASAACAAVLTPAEAA